MNSKEGFKCKICDIILDSYSINGYCKDCAMDIGFGEKNEIENMFKNYRFNERHLALGDIRLTYADQEKIIGLFNGEQKEFKEKLKKINKELEIEKEKYEKEITWNTFLPKQNEQFREEIRELKIKEEEYNKIIDELIQDNNKIIMRLNDKIFKLLDKVKKLEESEDCRNKMIMGLDINASILADKAVKPEIELQKYKKDKSMDEIVSDVKIQDMKHNLETCMNNVRFYIIEMEKMYEDIIKEHKKWSEWVISKYPNIQDQGTK